MQRSEARSSARELFHLCSTWEQQKRKSGTTAIPCWVSKIGLCSTCTTKKQNTPVSECVRRVVGLCGLFRHRIGKCMQRGKWIFGGKARSYSAEIAAQFAKARSPRKSCPKWNKGPQTVALPWEIVFHFLENSCPLCGTQARHRAAVVLSMFPSINLPVFRGFKLPGGMPYERRMPDLRRGAGIS